MKRKPKIKVRVGTSIKREAVLLGRSGDIIEEGQSSKQLLAKHYGRQ